MRRPAALLLPLLLVLVACGSPERPDTAAPPSSTSGTATSRPPSAASTSPSPVPRRDTTSPQAEEGAARCSAAGLPAELAEQDALPDPVAQTRQALYRAAVQCDLERLAALAPDEGFTWSFGLEGDPAEGWRAAEQRGDAPMRYLAGVLRLPHGRQQVQGRTLWVWPEAHAAGPWSAVPESARQDLRALYDERDLRSWEQFGAYAGYRVVVADDGTWQAFVAGD